MSTLTIVNAANRLVNFLAIVYALYYVHHHEIAKNDQNDAGVWKYLTAWTSTVHAVFFGMCLLCEVFWYLKFRTAEFSFRGLIFHGVVFPMGLSVFVNYWLLYHSDKELIVAQSLPPFIDHIIHTLILPGVLIESFTYHHPIPRRKDGLSMTWAIQLGYMGLVFYMGITRNNWVYPFMAMLPMPLRIAFCVVTMVANTIYYILGEKLHNRFWEKHLKEQ
jgi:phosphatidylserine synthase